MHGENKPSAMLLALMAPVAFIMLILTLIAGLVMVPFALLMGAMEHVHWPACLTRANERMGKAMDWWWDNTLGRLGGGKS